MATDIPSALRSKVSGSVERMRRIEGPIYEYGCHEGNYSLRNILAGARKQERETEKDSPIR